MAAFPELHKWPALVLQNILHRSNDGGLAFINTLLSTGRTGRQVVANANLLALVMKGRSRKCLVFRACRGGYTQIIKWLYERNPRAPSKLWMETCIKHGRLGCALYLHSRGAPSPSADLVFFNIATGNSRGSFINDLIGAYPNLTSFIEALTSPLRDDHQSLLRAFRVLPDSTDCRLATAMLWNNRQYSEYLVEDAGFRIAAFEVTAACASPDPHWYLSLILPRMKPGLPTLSTFILVGMADARTGFPAVCANLAPLLTDLECQTVAEYYITEDRDEHLRQFLAEVSERIDRMALLKLSVNRRNFPALHVISHARLHVGLPIHMWKAEELIDKCLCCIEPYKIALLAKMGFEFEQPYPIITHLINRNCFDILFHLWDVPAFANLLHSFIAARCYSPIITAALARSRHCVSS